MNTPSTQEFDDSVTMRRILQEMLDWQKETENFFDDKDGWRGWCCTYSFSSEMLRFLTNNYGYNLERMQ